MLTIPSFASDNPPVYAPDSHPKPVDPATGRSNNQGFEGLAVSGDGKTLYAVLQSATIQDGGLDKNTNRYARLLKYDITIPTQPRYARQYVVPLPLYVDVSTSRREVES